MRLWHVLFICFAFGIWANYNYLLSQLPESVVKELVAFGLPPVKSAPAPATK